MLKILPQYIGHVLGLQYKFLLLASLIAFNGSICILNGQESSRMKDRLNIAYVTSDFPISDLDNKNWDRAEAVSVMTYWSGASAPVERQFTVHLLWSGKALYVRFDGS